jgi:hypothetical protein
MNRFVRRVYYAIGPVGAGAVLDLLDLATFGPIGLMVGGVIGGVAGWVLADCEGLGGKAKCACVVGAAMYMTVPWTEPFPVATSLGLLSRFFRETPPRNTLPTSGGHGL